MALHFSVEEYQSRISKTTASLDKNGLDGLLIFSQENMYYLTGYDTFGFCFFQCLFLSSRGEHFLLTRSPDLRQAKHTSTIKHIHIWKDMAHGNPCLDLRKLLDECGCGGKRLGVEYNSYGLNAANGLLLNKTLRGFCALSDASFLIRDLRTVKSPKEMEYVRKAGLLADKAYNAALEKAAPGAYEGDILATLQSEIFKGGGEYPGNENIIGSGRDALLCRSKSGRTHLESTDQMTLEFAATYNRYHVALMRTVLTGSANALQRRMFETAYEALLECRKKISPGYTMGDVFDAYADTCDKNGMGEHRLNATGYSLGAVFSPTWMDFPMFYKNNPFPIRENMVLFLHIILMNSRDTLAMCIGETYLTTKNGNERLSSLPIELTIRR